MDDTPWHHPEALPGILADAGRLGFAMSCEPRTGSLLATLAASKPGGRILELGTGVGAGAAWLLHGMDTTAHLLTVEADDIVQTAARHHLSADPRIAFDLADADAWITTYKGPRFTMAYVDCRPGKFHRMDELLDLLEPGGLYIVDDLLPQPTWPDDHQQRVDDYLASTPHIPKILATPMTWASGLLIGARI